MNRSDHEMSDNEHTRKRSLWQVFFTRGIIRADDNYLTCAKPLSVRWLDVIILAKKTNKGGFCCG